MISRIKSCCCSVLLFVLFFIIAHYFKVIEYTKEIVIPITLKFIYIIKNHSKHNIEENKLKKKLSLNEVKHLTLCNKKECADIALITPEEYLEEFSGVSPLNKCRLKEKIEEIIKKKEYKLIVIDLDISIDLYNYKKYANIHNNNIECFEKFFNFIQQVAENKTIIFPKASILNLASKNVLDQTKEHVEIYKSNFTNILFGSSLINIRHDTVYEYYKKDPYAQDSYSLGFLSYKILTNKELLDYMRDDQSRNSFSINHLIREFLVSENKILLTPNILFHNKDINNASSVLFIGGAYDTRDRFISFFSYRINDKLQTLELPGVVIHAIGYLSFYDYFTINKLYFTLSIVFLPIIFKKVIDFIICIMRLIEQLLKRKHFLNKIALKFRSFEKSVKINEYNNKLTLFRLMLSIILIISFLYFVGNLGFLNLFFYVICTLFFFFIFQIPHLITHKIKDELNHCIVIEYIRVCLRKMCKILSKTIKYNKVTQ